MLDWVPPWVINLYGHWPWRCTVALPPFCLTTWTICGKYNLGVAFGELSRPTDAEERFRRCSQRDPATRRLCCD